MHKDKRGQAAGQAQWKQSSANAGEKQTFSD